MEKAIDNDEVLFEILDYSYIIVELYFFTIGVLFEYVTKFKSFWKKLFINKNSSKSKRFKKRLFRILLNSRLKILKHLIWQLSNNLKS